MLFDTCLMKNEGERRGKMKGRKNQKKAKMKKWSEKGWGVRTEELPRMKHF